FGFLEQAIDTGLTGVVRGKSEPPVAEMMMKLPQAFGGGAGAFVRVKPLVPQPGDGKPLVARGFGGQLKHSRRTRRTARVGIEGRFHFGQPNEFRRRTLGGEN